MSVYAAVLLPCIVLIISAIVGIYTNIPKAIVSAFEHFAGGIVMSALAITLVPMLAKKNVETGDYPELIPTVIGYAIGVAFVLVMRQLFPEDDEDLHEEMEQERVKSHGASEVTSDEPIPVSATTTAGVDMFVNGVVMGMAYATGPKAGVIVMLAMCVEMAAHGCSTLENLKEKGVPTGKMFVVIGFLAWLLFSGGVLGFAVVQGMSGFFFYGFLAFGVSSALWLVIEDLLHDNHADKDQADQKIVTSVFFVGFVIPIALQRFAA